MKKSLIILITILVCSCASQTITLKEVNPVDNWDYQPITESTPESQGVDSEKLNQLIESVDFIDIDGIVILRHGKKIFEQYNEPFSKDMTHNLFSVTKSVNATLIGITIDQGYLESVDTRVLDIFPEYQHRAENPIWNEMTVRDLLTMTAGLPQDYGDVSFWHMIMEKDWLSYIFELEPLKYTFRKKFIYSNLSSCLLSSIVAKTTGYSPLDYARENLFRPLGITNYSWDYQSPAGIQTGATNLNLRTEDMAKLGQLYLDKGLWNGQRVVSEEWIIEATKRPEENFGRNYGFQWWLDSDGTYAGQGSLGQILKVYPEYDLVVAFQSTITSVNWTDVSRLKNLFSSKFLKTLSDKPLDEISRIVVNNMEEKKIDTPYQFINIEKEFNFSENSLGFDKLKLNHTDDLYQFDLSIKGSDNISLTFKDADLGKNIEFSNQEDVLDYLDYRKKQLHSKIMVSKQWVFSKLLLVEDNNLLLQIRRFPATTGYDIKIKVGIEKSDVKITDMFHHNGVSLSI